MNVLVTGSTGGIGGYVVDRLLQAGHTLRTLDIPARPDRTGVEHIPGDVRDLGLVRRAVQGMEAVVHLAAIPYDMDRQDALHFIHKTDKDRARYLRDHFRKNIDDPLLYHLVINTDRVSYEDAARLIGDEVIQRFHLDKMTQAALAGP